MQSETLREGKKADLWGSAGDHSQGAGRIRPSQIRFRQTRNSIQIGAATSSPAPI